MAFYVVAHLLMLHILPVGFGTFHTNPKRKRGKDLPPRLRFLMLRYSSPRNPTDAGFFAPKGPKHNSPGQSAAPPWVAETTGFYALKGQNKPRTPYMRFADCIALSGLRTHWVAPYPGRCPGLVCGCPFGAFETRRDGRVAAQDVAVHVVQSEHGTFR